MCPGSRSAPLVIAFSRNKKIQLYPIVDERSAAYFALGMAQFLKKPVGIFCTSGTAALNFSPAIAEAFYQEIPLVVMTADRPSYLIGQQDGQAIKQTNVYQNFIEASFELPEKISDENDLKQSDKIINDAINISISKSKPVHINVPLEEPLYEQEENTSIPYLTEKVEETLSEGAFKLKEVLNNLLLFFKKTEVKKKKQIHLGQWSFKNHPDVFEVAKQLTAKGYYCYFSTNFKDFAAKNSNYEVVYFEQFEDYLTQMAASEFTLALTAINEGWNRVAHESILVGTPVIAYAKAGLLDLVNESNSYAAISIADVLKTIENKNVQVNSSLLANYNIKNVNDYLNKILI
jgi:2-succinyl-5-enolpyruvyl-6-hydroxy-3-cyclohexene-1-carboxylate synthase